MADERGEAFVQAGKQRILQAVGGQFDGDAAQGFTVGAVDEGALVPAQRADPVAGPEEREVLRHDDVQQPGELAFHAVLGFALVVRRVAGGEGAAAHNHARVVGQVQLRQGDRLKADSPQLCRFQAAEAQI